MITLGIFVFAYILIFSGKFDRTTAALIGVITMLAAGYALNFMSLEEMLGHVDWEVIILLFGMMTFVGELAQTGFFKFIGVKTLKLARGKPWLMFVYLTLMTAFVSMFIDNVTTVLLMIPLTIEACEIMRISPIPLILGEAVFSNIGGTETLIGDPPNILVGIAAKLSFNSFIVNLTLPVLLSISVSLFLSKIVYPVWFKSHPRHIDSLMKLNEWDYVKSHSRMKALLLLLGVMIFFFATEDITGIPVSFVALIGGTIALAISENPPHEVFKAVEWPTLVFFISLFSLVGGLDETGLLDELAGAIASISTNPVLIAIVILWVAGLTSSVVDNIPITAALIPVVGTLTSMYHTSMLWWALIIGADIGGNLTPIGSSAGVISVGMARKLGYEIYNRDWFRLGATTGIASLVVSSLALFLLSLL